MIDEPFSPNELLGRFLLLLLKHKWLCAGTFVLTIVLVGFLAFLIEPSYKATAKILVQPSSQQQLILFRDVETPGGVNPKVHPGRNLVEISTSRGIAEVVVKKFHMDAPREINSARDCVKSWIEETLKSPITLCVKLGVLQESPPNYLADAIDELIEDLQDIELRQDTEIIDLSIWGPDPELATGIANTMAKLLVEKTRDLTRKQANEAYEFTKEQVAVAETSLQVAEKSLDEFRRNEKIASLPDQRQLLLERLDKLQSDYAATLGERQQAEARLAEVRREIEQQQPTIVSSSVSAANAIVREVQTSLHTLAGQLASRMVEKATSHPEVNELRAQVKELTDRLAQEPPMVPESETTVPNPVRQNRLLEAVNLTASLAGLRVKEQFLSRNVADLESEVADLPRKELLLDRLTREKNTHEERFTTLKTKLLEFEVQRATHSSEYDIRVIDAARIVPDASPDYPNLALIAVVGLMLASFFSVILPLLREYLDDAFDTPREVRKALALPVLGTVPRYGRQAPASPGNPAAKGGAARG